MSGVDYQIVQFFLNALARHVGLRLEVRDEGGDAICEVFKRGEWVPEESLRLVGANVPPPACPAPSEETP